MPRRRLSYVVSCYLAMAMLFGDTGARLAHCQTPASSDPLVQRVMAAWQERGAYIKTARLKWRMHNTDRKGCFDRFAAVLSATPPFPAHDRTYEDSGALIYDGRRIRMTQDGESWRSDTGTLNRRRGVQVFDGRKMQTQDAPLDANDPAGGTISAAASFRALQSCEILPLGLFLRPTDPSLGAPAQTPLDRRPDEDEGGLCCLASSHHPLFLWVDPAQPACIRRFQYRRLSGEVRVDGVIEWNRDPAHGPTPQHWIATILDEEEQVERVHDVTVTECVLNAPIAAEEFAIKYDPGAAVSDDIARVRFVANESGVLQPANLSRDGASYTGIFAYSLLGAALLMAVVWWRLRR